MIEAAWKRKIRRRGPLQLTRKRWQQIGWLVGSLAARNRLRHVFVPVHITQSPVARVAHNSSSPIWMQSTHLPDSRVPCVRRVAFLYSALPASSGVCRSLVKCAESSCCSSFQLRTSFSPQRPRPAIGGECCDSWQWVHGTAETVPCSA